MPLNIIYNFLCYTVGIYWKVPEKNMKTKSPMCTRGTLELLHSFLKKVKLLIFFFLHIFRISPNMSQDKEKLQWTHRTVWAMCLSAASLLL